MSDVRATEEASWPGTKVASGRENCLMLLTLIGPLHFGDSMSTWPSIWGLGPDVLFPRSFNLAAIDMKLVAVN